MKTNQWNILKQVLCKEAGQGRGPQLQVNRVREKQQVTHLGSTVL
jgi:hypothetical protein